MQKPHTRHVLFLKKVKSKSYLCGVFYRSCKFSFMQGNQLCLRFGVSCEKVLCGYLRVKDCPARPLVLPYHTCSVGCCQRNRVQTEAGKKPLPPSSVFITMTHPKGRSEAGSVPGHGCVLMGSWPGDVFHWSPLAPGAGCSGLPLLHLKGKQAH